jgi:hypothetical protein
MVSGPALQKTSSALWRAAPFVLKCSTDERAPAVEAAPHGMSEQE